MAQKSKIIEFVHKHTTQSLASRVVFSVFMATLLTSLVVTWVSTQSIHGFLRAKIDQKFPAILSSTAARLDLWYEQRKLDVSTFAGSATVSASLPELRNAAGSAEAKRARREVDGYLSYVLERFPQYRALFLLDRRGRLLASSGSVPDLPADMQRESLAEVQSGAVSEILQIEGQRVQVASVAVRDAGNRAIGSLHAVLRVEAVDELLKSDRLGPSGTIFLVGPENNYLTPSGDTQPGAQFGRVRPELGALAAVDDYSNELGVRVVGSARRLGVFDWTLLVEESYAEAFLPTVRVMRQVLLINLATVLLFSGVAVFVARSIARPIQALSAGATRIVEGEVDVEIPETARGDELGLLTRTFNRMAQRLQRNAKELHENRLNIEAANVRLRGQNEELQRMNETLEQLSITDGLTKLYNHRFFQENLTREIARISRSGAPLTLVLADIDNFKALNDRYGHAAGDQVLCEVARIMSGIVRESDVLARYGGEEFALVPSQIDLEGAVGLAEKIRMAIAENPFRIDDAGTVAHVPVTVSIGVAAYRRDRKTFFNDADRALYRAKAEGKDCVAVETGEDEPTA